MKGHCAMEEERSGCPYERAYSVEFQSLKEDLRELKTRVGQLESTLARGVMLLVANLAGMVVTLARQWI